MEKQIVERRRERECMHLFNSTISVMFISTGGEEFLLLFCSDVSLLLWCALHSCHFHVTNQLREGQT